MATGRSSSRLVFCGFLSSACAFLTVHLLKKRVPPFHSMSRTLGSVLSGNDYFPLEQNVFKFIYLRVAQRSESPPCRRSRGQRSKLGLRHRAALAQQRGPFGDAVSNKRLQWTFARRPAPPTASVFMVSVTCGPNILRGKFPK